MSSASRRFASAVVEARIDLPGPVGGRPGAARPADPAVEAGQGDVADLLHSPRGVGGDALRRQPVEDAGVCLSDDEERGAVGALAGPQAARVPVRQQAEVPVGRVPHARGRRPRLVIGDVHEPGARAVGGLGERDDELAVLRMSGEEEDVVRLERQARDGEKVGVAGESRRVQHLLRLRPVLGRHRGEPTKPLRRGLNFRAELANLTAMDTAAVQERARGENFPVASLLFPRALRPHLRAVYGYCRLVDILGDEIDGDRPAALDELERELGALLRRASRPGPCWSSSSRRSRNTTSHPSRFCG